jgi:transglutaminase-like putative cysteine protease
MNPSALAHPTATRWRWPGAHWPRETRDTLFLLAVIAWVMAPLLARLPLWCAALTALALLWRATLAWRCQPLPHALWRLGLLALAVLATAVTYKTLLGRDAGVTLLVMLLALKTLELRARRDAFVVFFLSFFLMLTQFFYSQSLLTAANMFIALWGLLAGLVNAHLPVGQPPLWQSLRTAGLLTLWGTPVMVALFVLFPRVAPLWGLPQDAQSGHSGLSGDMTVGQVANLTLDDGVAFRVQFDGPAPPRSELYFRGPVLSQFDGQRWTSAESASDFGVPQVLPGPGAPVHYRITQEPNKLPWLLPLDLAALAPHLEAGSTASVAPPRADAQWRLNAPIADLLRYSAQSLTHYQLGPLIWQPELRRDLRLPEGVNPRTRLWAADLLATATPGTRAQDWVATVLERLRSGGYVYTLEPGVYGRDSADEFWFDRKAGFCEHIASSFVVLMRALKVPARVVTGYQGGELNSLDGFWTVRQSDAHAWAEVWVEGQGWVRVDPTAAVSPGRVGSFTRFNAGNGVLAQALLGNVSPQWAQRLRAVWDAANNRWNQWVLNYSPHQQFNLLAHLGFEQPSWQDLLRLLAGLVASAAALAALGAWLWRSHTDPWLKLLAQARHHWARRGLATPAHTTARELALALQNRPPGISPLPVRQAWLNWLAVLEAQRYAPTQPATPGLGELRHQLRQLRRQHPPRRPFLPL